MPFILDHSVGFLINRANMRMKNELSRNFKPYDITPEQWGLLNRLYAQDGLSQRELSEKAFKDQPTTTRIVDHLVKKGLVKRNENPQDRRTYLLYITDEGRGLIDRLIPLAEKTLDKALQGFAKDEIEQLRVWCNRIYKNLE